MCYKKKGGGHRSNHPVDVEDKEEAEDCVAVEDVGATLEVTL